MNKCKIISMLVITFLLFGTVFLHDHPDAINRITSMGHTRSFEIIVPGKMHIIDTSKLRQYDQFHDFIKQNTTFKKKYQKKEINNLATVIQKANLKLEVFVQYVKYQHKCGIDCDESFVYQIDHINWKFSCRIDGGQQVSAISDARDFSELEYPYDCLIRYRTYNQKLTGYLALNVTDQKN